VPDHRSRWLRRVSNGHRIGPAGGLGEGLKQQPSFSSLTPEDGHLLRAIHNVRHLMSGEWTWDVLMALHAGPLQYTNILNSIRAEEIDTGWPRRKHRRLQDSPLNRTLRRLEQGELVTRTRELDFPYRATYELSLAARELIAGAGELVVWADAHRDLLDRARQRRHAADPNR